MSRKKSQVVKLGFIILTLEILCSAASIGSKNIPKMSRPIPRKQRQSNVTHFLSAIRKPMVRLKRQWRSTPSLCKVHCATSCADS